MRVLIVDDSTVYRSQIRAALTDQEGVEIAGSAASGAFALEWLKNNAVDVITLDMEMPGMSGLDFLRELKVHDRRTRVILFSSTTATGVDSALQALRLGADDVVSKPTFRDEDGTPALLIRRHLLPKILQFSSVGVSPISSPRPSTTSSTSAIPSGGQDRLTKMFPKALLIASSTGGPDALEKLFAMIAPPFTCPILITQHMPPVFTTMLASRLSKICGATVSEAKQGEVIQSGRVYLAPGNHHLRVRNVDGAITVELDNLGPLRNFVRPAADHMFETAAKIYRNACVALILTGMGSDGRDGAVAVRAEGGAVMIQDKASCVVFGMPGAVQAAGAYDREGDLARIAEMLVNIGIATTLSGKGSTNAQ